MTSKITIDITEPFGQMVKAAEAHGLPTDISMYIKKDGDKYICVIEATIIPKPVPIGPEPLRLQ